MLGGAVRPKREMDAEDPIHNEIVNGAVRPKSDDESAAVDEDVANKQEKKANDEASAAKNILENDEVTNEEVRKQIRECSERTKDQTDKKRYNEFLRSSEESRTCLALNLRRGQCSFQKFKTTNVKQSHRKQGLQMSRENSTVNYMQAMKLKRRFKIP